MDRATYQAIVQAMKKEKSKSQKLFEKWDNTEDMHRMEAFETVLKWFSEVKDKIP